MNALSRLLTERLVSGLQRKSVVTPSKWAETYRVMGSPYPGPWTFKRHPWLRGMHDSEADYNVGQKAAQMGFTETVLNVCFYYIDIYSIDCLYILPAKTPDASDFSAARFDPAIEASPHLKQLFSDVKNVGHKRAGTTNLYLRGSKSRAGLKSIPVGILIMDEKDEMNQVNIPLAEERQSGYSMAKTWEISTPTIDGFGINITFINSSQNAFFFKCPGCGKFINLEFPRNMEICGESQLDLRINNSYIKCHLCSKKLDHEQKPCWLSAGCWVEQYSDRETKGWGINQLYSASPKVSPANFVKAYFKARTNPADEQEFYNSKLGIPHIVEGARISDADIKHCIGEYVQADAQEDGLITMGVDVGTYLHYEIDKWSLNSWSVDASTEAKPRVIKEGSVTAFEDLDLLMRRFNVKSCVIDSQPERRKAYEFACRWWGAVRLCFYGRGVQGKQIHLSQDDELMVTVDRTSWLDLALGRFKTRQIILPRDLSHEYKEHIKSPVRIYEKDADGNPIGKYVKGGNTADHLAHARNYAEIALPLALSAGVSHSMSSPV